MPRVPRLLSGPNVRSLNLPPAEAYLLSRVDGVLSEDDLAFVTGLAPEEAAAALDRLALLGAVDFGSGSSTPPGRSMPPGASTPPAASTPPRASTEPPRGPAPFSGAGSYDPAELDEPVDLEPERKKRVLDLFYRLDELTYYEILGVATEADKKQVKSAYYAIAPDFHPDKFFRKNLGSFKAKIEAIFARFTLAHDILTDKEKRADYDEYLAQTQQNRKTSAVLDQTEHDVAAILAAVEQAAAQALARAPTERPPPVMSPRATPSGTPATPTPTPYPGGARGPVSQGPPAAVSPDVLRQRREALARKLMGGTARRPGTSPPPAGHAPTAEMDPILAERTAEAMRQRQEAALAEARMAQVKRYLDAGRSALETQDYAGAANSYRIASSLAPDDLAVKATCDEALQRVAVALADGYWKQAVYEEGQERWAEAALSYSKVCTGRPDSAPAHERVAYTTFKSGGNPRRAVEFARRSIELDPKKPEFRVTLARTYAAAGLEKSAHAELDRALEIAPKDAKIQSLVSAARATIKGPEPEKPKEAPKEEGAPKAKVSGFHNFVAAVRSAIAPKDGK
jgi:tetratricopeptide (TPR) repeat protein